MSEIFNKYKHFCLPVILGIVYVFFIVATWGKWGHVVSDSFREAIIPQALLEGKVFYSDITNLYSPLAYWLNASLFAVFGSSLNVLYFAGIVNSLIILSTIYFITKKFSSDFTAFTVVLTIMEIFTFRITMLNSASWFFPYSYSFIYAFSACLLALLAFILYKEKNELKYLFITFFLSGLSFAFKADFLLFAIIPFVELIKNKSVKQFFTAFACFAAPCCLTLCFYLLFGGSISAVLGQIQFLSAFSKAPSVLLFNKLFLPQTINLYVIQNLICSTIGFATITAIFGLCVSAVFFAVNKLKNNILKAIISMLGIFFGYTILITLTAKLEFIYFGLHANLVCIPYFVIIGAICVFIFKDKGKNCTKQEKFFILLAAVGFLTAFRLISSVFISYIGNFIMPIFWLAFVFFCMELLPEYFPKLKTENYKKITATAFIAIGLTFSYLYFYLAGTMNTKINSSKGSVYVSENYAKTINDTLDYINQNVPKDKTLLVMEEGLIFNYLTDRKTDLKYYALIPHIIDTFGEEKIISEISKNPPDYVFITNNIYPTKLGGKFGIDYAKQITAYVFDNYEYVQSAMHPELGKGFEIAILKKK